MIKYVVYVDNYTEGYFDSVNTAISYMIEIIRSRNFSKQITKQEREQYVRQVIDNLFDGKMKVKIGKNKIYCKKKKIK